MPKGTGYMYGRASNGGDMLKQKTEKGGRVKVQKDGTKGVMGG